MYSWEDFLQFCGILNHHFFLVIQTFFILCGFISQLLALILVNEVLFRQSFPVRTSYKVLPMLSSTNPRVLDVTFSS